MPCSFSVNKADKPLPEEKGTCYTLSLLVLYRTPSSANKQTENLVGVPLYLCPCSFAIVLVLASRCPMTVSGL